MMNQCSICKSDAPYRVDGVAYCGPHIPDLGREPITLELWKVRFAPGENDHVLLLELRSSQGDFSLRVEPAPPPCMVVSFFAELARITRPLGPQTEPPAATEPPPDPCVEIEPPFVAIGGGLHARLYRGKVELLGVSRQNEEPGGWATSALIVHIPQELLEGASDDS